VEEGCPELPLEAERPEDLETISFSLDEPLQQAIEDASVAWSSGERLVDKSQIVRALIVSAAREHLSDDSAS